MQLRDKMCLICTQQLCQFVKFTNYSSSSSIDDDIDGVSGGGGSNSISSNNNRKQKKMRTVQLQVNLPIPQHTNNDTCFVRVYRKKSVMRDTTYVSGCFILTGH